jgi:hypothetical protein
LPIPAFSVIIAEEKHSFLLFSELKRSNIMQIKILDTVFAICRIHDLSKVNFKDEFYFLGKTDEELSLVCIIDSIPENVIACDKGWRAFRIQGELDFSLVGILSRIAALLAANKISIFVVSTYNTDYVLIKTAHFEDAVKILKHNGYIIV